MDFFNRIVEQFIRANRKLRRWQRAVSLLSALVVFFTTYALVLPAITLDKETASEQPGIEIAASDNEADSGGTVYEAELEEEPAEETQEEESGESQADESEAPQDAEVPEEDNFDDDTAADHGQNTEEQAGSEEAEDPSDDEDTASDAAENDAVTAPTAETLAEGETLEEVRLITEETQLIYEYIDEYYADGIDDENDDGIDDGYFVYAEFGADAKLPEGVELSVKEITKESDPEVYEAYYEKALSGLQDKYDEKTALSFARFYDIKFIYNGEEVEPSGDVKVRIEYNKAVEIEKEVHIDAVLFDKDNDEEPEVIDSEVNKAEDLEAVEKDRDDIVKTVEFETARISVYGITGSYIVELTEGNTSAENTAETETEAETAEEIKLITEETQLTYEYTDKNKEDGIDDGYIVYAEFGADAKLPEGVELRAGEITKESDPKAYEAYYEKALSGLQDKYDENTVLSFARFYDIRFVYNGEEVEPSGDVKVRIEYKKAVEIEKETNVDTVHFDKNNDEEPEVIESEVNRSEGETDKNGGDDAVKTVDFESAQFSVYGILVSYTVDFHWEVDGKTYDFSIPGGGFVSFAHIIEVLGISNSDTYEDPERISEGTEEEPDADKSTAYEQAIRINDLEVSEATWEFLSNVESVEFSSPELVWVRKAENSTTVGALKEENDLNCRYSAELTEEQISEINAQTVDAGDWALISIYPFDTEESLTVTMRTGEQFAIQMTDDNVELGSSLFRDIRDGKYFYLYTYYEGDQGPNMSSTRGDYYLKYDGSSKRLNQYMHNIDEEVIDELGNDYLWQIIWEEDSDNYYGGAWKIRSAGHPDYCLSLEDYYTISSDSGGAGLDIYVKTADGTDALIFLGNADEEYYDYYESEFDFSGFSFNNDVEEFKLVFNTSRHTFDIESSDRVLLGATIKAVSVDHIQPVITYTQDDINKGTVSFTDDTNTAHTTNSDQLTVSQDTMSSGQSRYMVTAQPAEGYHLVEWQVVSGTVTAWGSSSGKTAQSLTIQPVITGESATLKAVFAPNETIAVTQNDIEQGHVEYNNGTEIVATNGTETIINVSTVGPSTEGEYKALYNITAVPADDYRFVKWVVEGDGHVVSWGKDGSMTEYTTQICPYVDGGNVTIKALFERIPTGTTLDPSSAAGQLVSELMRELREDSADFKKTAHVVDEDKRIYEVDLSASSERKVIGPDITLSFITDISRSMYFPANLTEVTYSQYDNVRPNNLENWLRGHGRNSDGSYNTYYMIADINGTATVLALFNEGGTWKTMDASYYDDIAHAGEEIGTSGNYRAAPPDSRRGGFSSTYLQNNNGTYRIRTGGSYNGGYSSWYPISDLDSNGNIRLYTASSTSDEDGVYFTRLDYLKKAVNIISDVIYAVDANAEIGLITFAKKSYTRDENGNRVYSSPDAKSYVAELYGKDDGFPGLDNIVLTGGTRQDHGLETANDMNWYGINPDHPQVAILITDGAPNTADSGNNSDPWGNLIGPRAATLKNQDVELYTLGLSLENVGTNMQSLYRVSGKKNTNNNPGTWDAANKRWTGIDSKYQQNAETGEETIERLMDILRSMEIVGNLLGSVSDTVDPAFYPVDENGYPIQEGVYQVNASGAVRLGDTDNYLLEDGKPREKIKGTNTANPLFNKDNTVKYYTWKEENGLWTITWYNQLIEKEKANADPGWTNSFRVKAKEDFLGGNAINTNEGEAQINADRFKQNQYPNTIGSLGEPVTASVSTPRVNVVELKLDEHSTEWTVYLDTPVNSRQELKSLYNEISVYERVTKADSDNRIDVSDPQDPGDFCLPDAEGANKIPLSQELELTDAEWDSLMSGETITHHYMAYGHQDVGIIKVELIKEGLGRKTVHLGEHPASPVGDVSEKYTLRVTYTPNPEDPSTVWNTTPGESRGRSADGTPMTSTNQHVVNVFAEPIRVLKQDDSGNDVRGAKFAIYREAKTGETGVSLAEYDETLTGSYYCISTQTTNSDGIATLAIPSDGQNSKNLLVPGETYYLIETEAPTYYKHDKTVRTVTVEAAYDAITDLAGENVTNDDYPYNWEEGVIIKVDDIPAIIVDTSGNPVVLQDDNNTGNGSGTGDQEPAGRSYVLSSDPVLFQTTILNMRITDFRFKKVSQDGNGLPGAVFQLKAIKNEAEVLVTEDSDYEDITGIMDEVEIEVDGVPTTVKSAFVTTGEEQILRNLRDGTYILEEVYVPDGYIKSIGKIRFIITGGIMRMDMGTPLPDDLVFIPARLTVTDPTLAFLTVINNPGVELPSTGGPGTNLIYILGIMLTGLAGAGLVMKRRRRNTV